MCVCDVLFNVERKRAEGNKEKLQISLPLIRGETMIDKSIL